VLKPQIKKILVPLDGSKNSFRGLDTAIYMARQCGAIITGLFVMPLYKGSFNPIIYDKSYLIKAAKEFMEIAKIRSAQNGIVFSARTVTGKESTEIIDFASKNKFDIIIIGARGLGEIKEALLGSTSHRVVQKSEIPVLIVK